MLLLLFLTTRVSSAGDCVTLTQVVTLEQQTVEVEDRVDCHPDPAATQERCEARGCVWRVSEPRLEGEEGPPFCYYPPDYGYSMLGEPLVTKDGYLVHLVKNTEDSMFGGEVSDIWLKIEMQKPYRLRIRISDDKPRFEVPITIASDGVMPSEPDYEVSFTTSPVFGVKVSRRSSQEVLLDTAVPGLVFSDQFIQLPVRLPAGSGVYGWGENEQHSFRHSLDWRRWAVYGRDQPPDGPTNMYGVHPRLTVIDQSGDTFGLLFLNSAAQEISLTPAPAVIYRTIGGLLDLYMFLGSRPEQVVQQYTEAVGRFPLPPYWSLGFHLCRYGYLNLDNMRAAVQRTRQFNIPQDAQWGDIDIMERNLDFTISQDRFGELPQYVDQLKEEGVRFVTIQDPCISTGEPNCTYRPFDLGEELDVWVKKASGGPVKGQVWPSDPVYFPDYTNPRTELWWSLLVREYHDTIAYDGLWIDMNEPSNFVSGDMQEGCASTSVNFPPYLPAIRVDEASHGLADKSLCGDAQHSLGQHYDVHNMFGWAQSASTLAGVREATGARGLVLSRSTFVGSGQWVAHW